MNHFRFYCTDTFNYFVLVWLFVKLCLATLANGKLLEIVCWRQYKFLSWIFFIYITLNFKKHIFTCPFQNITWPLQFFIKNGEQTISYHLYFLRISKVWSVSHHVSVGRFLSNAVLCLHIPIKTQNRW